MNSSRAPLDSRGLAYGFASYAFWGFFPLYWKLLADRAPLEILVHRMIWSFAFYALLFAFFAGKPLREAFRQSRRDILLSCVAAAILAVNWGLYIFAVNTGHILEGSLAYFINPLLNVAVGVVFFREEFPPVLKWAVGFAALGVAAKIGLSEGFPWIALVLAFTFCGYGVVKKLSAIPALASSVLEGAAGLPAALIGLAYFTATNDVRPDPVDWALFVGGGVVTGLPLFLFSFAAQRIPYSVMGILQFIAPSLQFLVGVAIFHEAFGPASAISFGLIWVGISFYLVHQLRTGTAKARPVAARGNAE